MVVETPPKMLSGRPAQSQNRFCRKAALSFFGEERNMKNKKSYEKKGPSRPLALQLQGPPFWTDIFYMFGGSQGPSCDNLKGFGDSGALLARQQLGFGDPGDVFNLGPNPAPNGRTSAPRAPNQSRISASSDKELAMSL